MSQEIIHTAKFKEAFGRLCQESVDKIFILTDETTHRLCRPLLKQWDRLDGATDIVIPPTDVNKNIETTTTVWSALADGGASRHSLMVCLGGGMVTDLGGFAASTFKRGLRFINIPTTLLAMVDAAVGGKTGVNFNALKNEIGVFNEAAIVVIDTDFLRTLDKRNMLSGYAEMLKHALLHDEAMWAEHLKMDFNDINYAQLQKLVEQSIEVKRHIVTIDPHEKGLRKALNLGHTVGHALGKLRHGNWQARVARICRGMGIGRRALPERRVAAFPARQDAPNREAHTGALRSHQLHLQRL